MTPEGHNSMILAPAKVNLHLGVHALKDARGYHRVDSVMVALDLSDVVICRDAEGLSVTFEPPVDIAQERTTAWRAARLLADELGVEPDVAITIERYIPEQAGLGGSSTDAGAVLRLLAERWGVEARDPRVVSVAKRVGADVAFFLDPRAAYLAGAGDELVETFAQVPPMPMVLVMPPCKGGSTPAAYAAYDEDPVEPADPQPMCDALRKGDVAAVARLLSNNLAPAARLLAPEVGEAEGWLKAQPGVIAAQVTGSGACSFAIVEDASCAEEITRAAKNKGWWAKPAMTVGFVGDFC